MTKMCEQISFEDLAQQFGTPLYVYSQNELSTAFARYQQAFSALKPLICYAVKANSNLSILRHFAQLGEEVKQAVGEYVSAVKDSSFPNTEESY